MDYIAIFALGGFLGIAVMSAMNYAKRTDDYDRGVVDGYKRGVTELEPYAKELQLREWVREQEGAQ